MLGFPRPSFSKNAARMWTKQLKEYRMEGDFWHVALMHRFLHDLGVPQKVTLNDKMIIDKGLKSISGGGGFLGEISGLHFCMRGIRITPGEKKAMIDELRNARRLRDGGAMGWILVHLRAMGLKVKATPEDKALIVKRLLKSRRGCNPDFLRGLRLAETYYLMQQLSIKPDLAEDDARHIRWLHKSWQKIYHPKASLYGAELNWYLKQLSE